MFDVRPLGSGDGEGEIKEGSCGEKGISGSYRSHRNIHSTPTKNLAKLDNARASHYLSPPNDV